MAAFDPRGVIPACLLPFHDDLSIDEAGFRAHLRDLAGVDGISAITLNAHATEVASCTFAEQQRVLDVAMDALGGRVPVVHGVYAEGSQEAARIARMAQAGGAAALLVFPPGPFTLGHTTAMALEHLRWIADASDLPLIVFQYPLVTRQGYRLETLLRMAEEFPTFRAIKDWCNDPRLHAQHIAVLHALPNPVRVLSTHSSWLFPSLVQGCDGLLSGAGSIIAELQVALFGAVQADDLAGARAVNQRMLPMTEAFYAEPFVDMHNRMKECLVLLGKQQRAVVRPPLVKILPDEIEQLRQALHAAGLLHARSRAA